MKSIEGGVGGHELSLVSNKGAVSLSPSGRAAFFLYPQTSSSLVPWLALPRKFECQGPGDRRGREMRLDFFRTPVTEMRVSDREGWRRRRRGRRGGRGKGTEICVCASKVAESRLFVEGARESLFQVGRKLISGPEQWKTTSVTRQSQSPDISSLHFHTKSKKMTR